MYSPGICLGKVIKMSKESVWILPASRKMYAFAVGETKAETLQLSFKVSLTAILPLPKGAELSLCRLH